MVITQIKVVGQDNSKGLKSQLYIEVTYRSLKSKSTQFITFDKQKDVFSWSGVRDFLNEIFFDKFFPSDYIQIPYSVNSEKDVYEKFANIIDKSKIPFIFYEFYVEGKWISN